MKYDLVFEGGGAKGMVFVGACEEFFGRGHSFAHALAFATIGLSMWPRQTGSGSSDAGNNVHALPGP